MRHQNIAIIGGTGFIGTHLACELGRRKRRVRIITRRRERDRRLLVIPTLEQVEADVHSVSSLSAALSGCDAVVNLVGILHSHARPGRSFGDVHAELPRKVAEAARFNRIRRVLHMSALGAAADAPSQYLRSKAAGEDAAHAQASEGMQVTSFRPSVVFGPGDGFLNLFARLLRLSPGVFPLACAQARFAPAYVGDVALAFANALDQRSTIGERYELCGPSAYTLEALVAFVARSIGVKARIVALPDALARLQARVLELVPGTPFTMDNYLSMQVDSVCTDNGFARLGMVPRSVEAMAPAYLAGSSKERLYSDLRASAGRD